MDLSTIHSEEITEKYEDYLTDESGLVKGYAEKIFFPKTEEELRIIVSYAFQNNIPITISAGGSGINGGRAPLGGWIIATNEMQTLASDTTNISENCKIWEFEDQESHKKYQIMLEVVDDSTAYLTCPISMNLHEIQHCLQNEGWFYPPDPTEWTCFMGGMIALNASGARGFKYGATRPWVHALRVILPDGDIVVEKRTDERLIGSNDYINLKTDKKEIKIPRPAFKIPNINKNATGPIIHDDSHVLDLFIGTDGIFGIISEQTMKVIRPPSDIVSMIQYCDSYEQALTLVEHCQELRNTKEPPVPLSVEFIDERALNLIRQKAEEEIPENIKCLIYLEQDAYTEDEIDEALDHWIEFFEEIGIDEDNNWTEMDKAGIEKHKAFRHALPEGVNMLVKKNGQAKLGSDFAVPEKHLREFFDLMESTAEKFETYQDSISPRTDAPGFVCWSHIGDCHFHLNFLPRSDQETKFAKDLLVDLMKKAVEFGGTISAEHGVGKKSYLNKPAIDLQYGQAGIDEIRKMKRIIDPNELLNRGNVIGVPENL